MSDINELAEKRLKSRIRKIKKCNKSDEEKEKFFSQLGTSFEIFFTPTKKSDTVSDSIMIWVTPEGKVLDAEYSYEEPEEEQYTSLPLTEKDLKPFLEALSDLKLELDDS